MLRVIRAYSIMGKEFHTTAIASQNELDDLHGKVEWLWVDCCDLEDKETTIISKLLGVEATTLDGIEDGKVRPSYEKCLDEECPTHTWISTSVVEFTDELKLHPMSIILKDSFLITMRNGHSQRIIESAVRTFRTLRQEERTSSFMVSKLLYEIIDENSGVMVSIREWIDKIEGEVLEKPRDKSVTRSIFKLKRGLSALHRLLWAERELLSDMIVGVIPRMKLTKEAKVRVDDSMDDIDRELEFVDSYNRSLDSVLRLQESARSLGLIHGVERTMVFVTVILIIMTLGLIILEMTTPK